MAAKNPFLWPLLCGFFLLACAADIFGTDQHDSSSSQASNKNLDNHVSNSTRGGETGEALLGIASSSPTPDVPEKSNAEKTSNTSDSKQGEKQQYLTDSDSGRNKNSEEEFASSTERSVAGRTSVPPGGEEEGVEPPFTERVDTGDPDSPGTQTFANTARPVSNNADEPGRTAENGGIGAVHALSGSGAHSQAAPGEAVKNSKGTSARTEEDGAPQTSPVPNPSRETLPGERGKSGEEGKLTPQSDPSPGKSELHRQHVSSGGDPGAAARDPDGSSASLGGKGEPNTTAAPGNGDKSPRTEPDLHNVVHSALTSDYDGEQVDQTSNGQNDLSTSNPIKDPHIEVDVGDEAAEDEQMDIDEDEEEEAKAAKVDESDKQTLHKSYPINNRIQHVQGNGEGTYFLADPSEENHVEMGEELHNIVGADDIDGEEDYYDDYYYDDDDDDWYYDDDEDEDDEYSDLDDTEDNYEGFDDDDYYYTYDDEEEDEDDGEEGESESSSNKGRTYEPGVMTDAEWIMREGRLGNAHRAKEYHIGQELHDFDTHLGPMTGSENEIRHVPFEYEPSYDGNNMSLLVFYTWLGVVAFMVIVALIALKHRQKISNLFWETKTGYRRDRSRLVTEEGHTLLSHQHV